MSRMRRLPALVLCLAMAGCGGGATDPSPSVRIAGAGWSFGFCLGACRGELDLAGSQLSYRVSGRPGDPVLADNRGRLTEAGSARLDSLASALPGGLLDRYGCPDCADGGASFVTLVREGRSQRVEYEYGRPPVELSALDEFLRGVMDALGRCEATPQVVLEGTCLATASPGVPGSLASPPRSPRSAAGAR